MISKACKGRPLGQRGRPAWTIPEEHQDWRARSHERMWIENNVRRSPPLWQLALWQRAAARGLDPSPADGRE